jgi:hypothetical protein
LSDSSVTNESSGFTVSPGLTKTSMTGTSLKSPMSGTLTGTTAAGPAAAAGAGAGLLAAGAGAELVETACPDLPQAGCCRRRLCVGGRLPRG